LTDNRDFAYTCEDYLKRIQVPTLIIAGDSEAGGYILPEEIEYYRGIVPPKVRITRWKGVGHGVSGQEPERYVREMLAFFEE
jgi:pimeloyl-ACP methyl ester carboxylesterase